MLGKPREIFAHPSTQILSIASKVSLEIVYVSFWACQVIQDVRMFWILANEVK
jgi:hypothetical protein